MIPPQIDETEGPEDLLARLEAHLRVLAHQNRLSLISQLRTPRTIQDLRLKPGLSRAGLNPQRPIARQSVLAHLDQLITAGVVRVASPAGGPSSSGKRFVLDHARLFAILEELRKLVALAPLADADPTETVQLSQSKTAHWEEGPKLVLVHGVQEGRTYSLGPTKAKPPRGWVIGRKKTAAVALEYDPYVSGEHAEITLRPRGFFLLDLRAARNGTFVNWERVPIGEEALLHSGDVIQVGKSLLVFRQK